MMLPEGEEQMDQSTFSDLEYQGKKRQTRREIFLERMDELIPWQRLEERIRPYYPEAGRGRRPYELSVMLRGPLCAVVLQPERPGHGGPAVRGGVGKAVRGLEAVGADARREHDTALSPSAGKTRVGPGPVPGD